jgi:FkbM family methyltransferase
MLTTIVSYLGDDAVFLDIGSNVGFFTMALARAIGPRGRVYAFEGQRVIFNMLAGSVALNSLLNVICLNSCVGKEVGRIELPLFDYRRPMSFGSVEFGPAQREKLAQDRKKPDHIDYVPLTTIDSLGLPKVSLMKIDVEGMELDVLEGAAATIERDRPVIFAEYLKVGLTLLEGHLTALGYSVVDVGGYNLLAISKVGPHGFSDPGALIKELTEPPADVPKDFDPKAYLILNPDVADAGMDPEKHFITFGWREGRNYSY